MKIELNKDQAAVLIQLLDLAVKSGGLQAASAALMITQKIDEAAKAEKDAE